MSFVERHATGVTIVLFIATIIGLSAAPIPSWLRPLDAFEEEDPIASMIASVWARAESVPRASQGQVAGGGGHPVVEEDQFVDSDVEGDPEEREIAPSPERPPWVPPERKAFKAWANRLGLSARPIDVPCLEPTDAPTDCKRRALDRFFERLFEVETLNRGAVRVVHYGDSLIASDKITDMVRRRLQERFGSAGKGFMMIKKFNSFQRGHRTGKASGGWRLDVITQRVLRDRYFGYTGASFTAENEGDETVFDAIGHNRRAEVFYLEDKKGGRVDILADEVVIGSFETATKAEGSEAMMHSVDIPPQASTLTLRAKTFGPRLFGVVLEADSAGVVYESIGLPGATSEVWNEPDAHDFERQLGHRDPALVVVMLGGNDGLMLSKKRTTIEAIEAHLTTFVSRIQAAAPKGDCLIVSPLEAVRQKSGRLIPKPEVLEVIRVQKRVARARGCAFWDMYASMGGEGSLAKWISADLMLPDLIHPRNRGSDLLGEMMAEAIMTAYDGRSKRPALRPPRDGERVRDGAGAGDVDDGIRAGGGEETL